MTSTPEKHTRLAKPRHQNYSCFLIHQYLFDYVKIIFYYVKLFFFQQVTTLNRDTRIILVFFSILTFFLLHEFSGVHVIRHTSRRAHVVPQVWLHSFNIDIRLFLYHVIFQASISSEILLDERMLFHTCDYTRWTVTCIFLNYIYIYIFIYCWIVFQVSKSSEILLDERTLFNKCDFALNRARFPVCVCHTCDEVS